jgi:hypothetical protein
MGRGADHCLCQPRYSGSPVLIACSTMSAERATPLDVVTPSHCTRELNPPGAMLCWTARQGFKGGAGGDLVNLRPGEKRPRPVSAATRFLNLPTKGLEGGTLIGDASNDRRPRRPSTERGSRLHYVEPLTFLPQAPPLWYER